MTSLEGFCLRKGLQRHPFFGVVLVWAKKRYSGKPDLKEGVGRDPEVSGLRTNAD